MRSLKKLVALALTLCLLTALLTTVASAEANLGDAVQRFATHQENLHALSGKMGILPTGAPALGSVNYLSRAVSNPNYNTLRNFISAYGVVEEGGNKIYVESYDTSGVTYYFSLINLPSGIEFEILSASYEATSVDFELNFILTNDSNYITIEGVAISFENNEVVDYASQTLDYYQASYRAQGHLPFSVGGYYGTFSASEFGQLMDAAMYLLCVYWDTALYNYLGFGLYALGFTGYSSGICTNHSYDNACDTTCNICGETRSTTHTYGGSCDTTCNVCGATRSSTNSHTYSADCDASCNRCGDTRTTGSNHSFSGNANCTLCNATFGDVSASSWMFSPVIYVYDNGLMAGKGSDAKGNVKFDPSSPITREEFVQVLYNAEGKPSVSIANRFPDVANNGWYKNAVLWANANNIANGQGDGKFGVGKNITRQDLALMLYKYASLKGYSLRAQSGEIYKYADGTKVSGYAQTAMDWAVTKGILSGKGTAGADISTFRLDPAGTATRAECAAMLKNFMTAFSGGNSDDAAVLSHAEYMAADVDTEITIEAYVQGTQEWWDDTIIIYAQDHDGGYYLYNVACSKADAARLVPGTKIRVTGYKSVWAGQHEIIDGQLEIIDNGDVYIAEPKDLTSYLGSDALVNYQGMLGAFKGLKIESIEYKNGAPGDDIYITASYKGFDYEFCVEYYLTNADTDVYKTVQSLKAGDIVDIEGFVYWYEGINPHITAISKR